MSAHAKYSPSAAHRWMSCPASIDFKSDTQSAYAEEGTRAHEVAERLLLEKSPKCDDNEMLRYCQDYVDYVNSYVENDAILAVEQKVYVNDECYGTADAIIATKNSLHVFDLKYGKGIKVLAKENPQLMIYALGACINPDTGLRYEGDVFLHIVQPRINNYSVWKTHTDRLYEFEDEVDIAIELCEDDDKRYNPSEKACQFCPNKGFCKALFKHTEEVLMGQFDNLDLDSSRISEDEMVKVLDNKKLIEKFLKAVEERATATLLVGETVGDYEMGNGRATRKYTEDAEEVLVETLGRNAYDTKLKSITAVERMIGKDVFEGLDITYKAEGNLKLQKKRK